MVHLSKGGIRLRGQRGLWEKKFALVMSLTMAEMDSTKVGRQRSGDYLALWLHKHCDDQLQKWNMSRCIQNWANRCFFYNGKRKSGATIQLSKTESVLKDDPMHLILSNLDTCIPAYTLLCSGDGWHYSPFHSDCGNGNDGFEL